MFMGCWCYITLYRVVEAMLQSTAEGGYKLGWLQYYIILEEPQGEMVLSGKQ